MSFLSGDITRENSSTVLNEAENRRSCQSGRPVLAVIAKNSIANLAKMAALSITVFLLPPLLVRVLSKPEYATWMLILQIGTYVALCDGSIQSAISRFVGRSRGLNDDRYMGQMLSSAGVIMLAVALLTAILTMLGSWQLDHLFTGIPNYLGVDARRALLIYGISLAASLPFSTLAGAFLGLQMNEVNAVAGSLGRIVGAVGAGWAAYRHQSLSVMSMWMAFGYSLQALMYLLAWKRLNMAGFIRRAHITRNALSEFVTFCYAIFATQLSGILITGLDIPIVAAFDFRSAGYYAVAATVSTMLSVPQAAVVNTMMPIAADISATATPERFGGLLIRATRYSSAILCLIMLPLMLGMGPFLRIWVGADYAGHAFWIAMILVAAQFIRLTLLPYAAFGFAAGQQNRMLISPLGEGVVNLICSLIGAYYLGAVGVALGTLIGACVGVLLHFFNSMPRTNHLAFARGDLALTGILRPMVYCLPAFLLGLVALIPAPNLIARAAVVCGCELLGIVFLWKLNFDRVERGEITGLVLRFAHL
jgi:O-antigen/teichoic acid export membrane protein